MRFTIFRFLCVLMVAGWALESRGGEPEPFECTRMLAHWAGYADPDYVSFVDETRPDLVQLGFYGAHFWSLVHTPQYGGYPAHFPVRGIEDCSKWLAERNELLHAIGTKVIGHFNIEFLVGDPDGPDGPRGFFKFYRDLWDEDLLGPRPTDDPLEFLERQADGSPITQKGYGIGGMREYWACLRNPLWQRVLKAWVRSGIQHGLDGYVINYFYRHDCLCRHCVSGFKAYLSGRFSKAEILSRFQIADLESHRFDEIVCWHAAKESTPLRLEMLRFSQVSNKEVFDDVFVGYGRSLKPDLILAQWNHIGDFGQISGDERCLLPAELWGRNESYLWYSTGSSACYSDLTNRFLGDASLQARYIRGASDDKPYTLGKYEGTRIRMAIAELAANGGAPMGFYTRFSDPEARRQIRSYYGFIKRYDSLYRANRSWAEVLLLYPRRQVHLGNVKPVDTFRKLGKRLLEEHVLFDVLPDDLATAEKRSAYQRVIDVQALEDAGAEAFDSFRQFDAPWTVQVSASRPALGEELTFHLVNYNRQEPPRQKNGRSSPGRGIVDERPIPARGVSALLKIPSGHQVGRVDFMTPESPDPISLKPSRAGGRIQFLVPDFLVYAVLRVHLRPVPRVAGVVTTYYHNSHADVIIGRLIQGTTLDDRGRYPGLELASLYTDQVPANDLSRTLAATYDFSIFPTVADSLTLGAADLAVDGVLLVAEHGKYPESPTGQTVFPKRRLFEQVVSVFKASGRSVPVFVDKHLADNWVDAKAIYDSARQMKIPLMAGSSLPALWRYPPVDVRRGARVAEIVAISYHRLDSYGFHALEMVQSLVERRAGGETGVAEVRCLEGDAVWEARETGLFDGALLDAALGRLKERPLRRGKRLEEAVKRPVLFIIRYRDGLQASVLTLNYAVVEWAAAWRYQEDDSVDSTLFWTQEARPFQHFTFLVDGIEKMVVTGRPTWPVERTLLTSGMLDALLISRKRGGEWFKTPYLDVAYKSTWNWAQPPPPPPGRPIRGP